MRKRSMRIFSLLAGVMVMSLLSVSLMGQAPAAGQSPLAEQVFKNITVLRGLPVDQFMGTMGFYASATGLNCTDCHTSESGGDWAKYADDTPLKQQARRMQVMMQTLNKTNFGGRQVVTCYTCHRGISRPNVMPSLDALYAEPPPDEPGDPFVQAQGQPSGDQVLDKYIAAIGGAQRVAAITSVVAKGTYIGFDDADKVPLELYARTPGHRATIVHGLLGNTTTTFDGREGWIQAPPTDKPVPLYQITGQELEGVKFEAELMFPSRIKQALTNLRVGLPLYLGEREVQPVQGNTAGGGTVTLNFDTETGLLARMVRYAESPVGRLVTRVDYDDYRDVNGVRMPFRWTVRWLSGRSTYEMSSIQANVALEASRFAKPR
jgi:photosynthetic reaction center cytochrome c subunit